MGGIRFNLSGREPEGIVDQGPAAEMLEDQLIQDLLDIVEERSRRPLVRRVLKTRDHYSGEHLNLLPDLLVEWDDAAAIGSALIGGGAGATVRAVSPKSASLRERTTTAVPASIDLKDSSSRRVRIPLPGGCRVRSRFWILRQPSRSCWMSRCPNPTERRFQSLSTRGADAWRGSS